jgi:hypothetical protein
MVELLEIGYKEKNWIARLMRPFAQTCASFLFRFGDSEASGDDSGVRNVASISDFIHGSGSLSKAASWVLLAG